MTFYKNTFLIRYRRLAALSLSSLQPLFGFAFNLSLMAIEQIWSADAAEICRLFLLSAHTAGESLHAENPLAVPCCAGVFLLLPQ